MVNRGRRLNSSMAAGIVITSLILAGCASGAAGPTDKGRGGGGNLPFPIASSANNQTIPEGSAGVNPTAPGTPAPSTPAPSSAAPSAPGSSAAPSAPGSSAAPSASTPAAPQGQAAAEVLPAVTAKPGAAPYCQPLAQAVNTLRQANTPGQGVSPEALSNYSSLMLQAADLAPEELKEGLRALAQSSATPANPQAIGAVGQGAQKDCGFSLA